MELDLRGQTITQAIAYFDAATEESAGEELNLLVDNEAVKLNLYNYIHKQGMACRAERKGPNYLIRVKIPRKKPGRPKTPDRPTAFPVNHLTGGKSAPPRTAREKPSPPPSRKKASEKAEPRKTTSTENRGKTKSPAPGKRTAERRKHLVPISPLTPLNGRGYVTEL